MKNHTNIAAGLFASAMLTVLAVPAGAATVDINIGVPAVAVQPQPVYVQPQTVYVAPRPVYVQPQYEEDWRTRQARATAWRDNPANHGQVVSASAHARNDVRKSKHKKHHGKNKHKD
jgi:hypothetical protein